MSTEPDQPTPPAADTVKAELDDLHARLSAVGERIAGFPAASDIDYEPLARFFTFRVINNLGDPREDGAYPLHTKPQEREAIDLLADLFRLPAADRWGYVAGGASEGTEYALHLARTVHPDPVVYYSTATHHAIVNVITRLGLRHVPIPADAQATIDYLDLADQIRQHRAHPVVIVANIGAAATEAVDDVRRITAILDAQAVTRRWIHADAALTGIPLATLDPGERPGFDFADGTDSLVVSGHKFLGTPMPCAAVLTRASRHAVHARAATYTGSADATIANSRSGLAALSLWYALRILGTSGLRDRAQRCRELAAYTHGRLVELGWPHADRLTHALTVTLAAPDPDIAARWCLPVENGRARIVVMPGLSREVIDQLLRDLHPTGHETVPLMPAQQRRSLLNRTPRRAAQPPAIAT